MNALRTQIKDAINNPTLQAALDKNAEQRLKAIDAAFGSLPEDRQVLRQRAHAVRADLIAHHERYLQQFVEQATANGLIVHHAASAHQAVQIVLAIARQQGAMLIAKSKTMVSEEMHLNRALLEAGITPVETDLGEYIVQLRDEPPSHIITPAVHLRRSDVGKTFQEKLGIPYTEDIPTLTQTARATLRQTFLNADLGISGVNFGVAETGSLCIVTNEGNGRMVTTLPRVHIALMGIERLAPTLDDLALMLALLPRSATGQQITVYTQLIHSPRRPGEVDGAPERHLILVDNGRSALRHSPLAESLYCIRCGACLNACPVFREIGGYTYAGQDGAYTPYPGPIGSIVSPGLFGQANFGHLAQLCTLCGACKEACPVDIDLPTLLLRVRAGGMQIEAAARGSRRPEGIARPLAWGLRLFAWFAGSPRRFALAQKLAAIFSRFWSPRALWMALPAITGWGYSKDFPRPAGITFRDRWARRQPASQAPQSRQEVSAEQQGDGGRNEPVVAAPLDPQALAARFRVELEKLKGVFVSCRQAELPGQILDLLRARAVTEVAAWEDAHLPAGLAEALRGAGITIFNAPHAEVRVGISGAVAGVAATATLAIPSGPGRPLTASLLPEIHLAILRQSDLHENLAQVLNLPPVRQAASVALVSGPSRTADIEMTLTLGVHGPGEIVVFCLSD